MIKFLVYYDGEVMEFIRVHGL